MRQLEKILVATDFEPASEDALKLSLLLAKPFASEITLIHVIPEMKDLPVARETIRKKVIDRLRQIQTDLERKGVGSVETVVRFGIPWERIIEDAEELDVNLIVVGSGQQGRRDPLGITAERVMIAADQPVLVVKRGSRASIRRILCPVDFSEASRRALKNGIQLSRTFQAHLTILRVFEPLLSSYFGVGRTPGASKEKILVKRQQQQFDRFLRGFDLDRLDWRQAIRRGKPHQEILRAIDEAKPDLVIMGSLGKTGLSRILMGSTTERVVRQMPCSVIVLKEEHLFRFPLEREVVDVEKHFRKGKELLEKQLTEGAVAQFEYCIRRDPFFIPAWEAVADAYAQMGQEKKAKRSKELAEYIRQHLWAKETGRSEQVEKME